MAGTHSHSFSLTVHFVGVPLVFIEMPSFLISNLFKDGYPAVEKLGFLKLGILKNITA